MIHKFSLFGYNIALDTESGSVHVLSDIAYAMLDHIKNILAADDKLPESCPVAIRYDLAKYSSDEVNTAYAELAELFNEGMLFSETPEFDASLLATEDMPLKAMCVHVSHECNMKCKYCFASEGNFGLKNSIMLEKTALKAMDFLFKNSKGRTNLEVDFFGGEPLLNFDVVKNTVKQVREKEKEHKKNVRFTLTTNGTLLNEENMDFINENISNIVLSLDGAKDTNDKMRYYFDGSGVYGDIVPKYQQLIAKRTNPQYQDYYVRGTFTRNNLDFCKDVLHMADLGFEHVSVEPVVTEEENDFSIRLQDLPAIFAEYEKLAKEIIKRHKKNSGIFNFFHFNIDIDGGPCLYKRLKGCGSGSEYVAVTPEGDIYPCHQFVGNEKYTLGSVHTKTLNRNKMKDFLQNNILTNEECRSCWAKYFCGGGCAANNANYCGNIRTPYKVACEMEKKRVECALAIKAVLD